MPSILPFPTPAQSEARLLCPTCGQIPSQRIDTTADGETTAACVCRAGHLFVIQWREGQ